MVVGFIVFYSCESPTESTGKNYSPGTRNYNWKTFSLSNLAPFNQYTKIWGTTPDSIWIIGRAGDYDKSILQFNGMKLNIYNSISIDPSSIFGFSSNNIWFAGSLYDIWKYDGIRIYKFSSHPIKGFNTSFWGDMWGTKINDLYAVGGTFEDSTGEIKSLVLHFDGITWNYAIKTNYNLQFITIRKSIRSQKYYLIGYKSLATGDSSYFYQFDGNNINEIKFKGSAPTNKSINLLDQTVYFNYDGEIYKDINNSIEFVVSLKGSISSTQFWVEMKRIFLSKHQMESVIIMGLI